MNENRKSVLTIGLSPTFQKQIIFSSFREDEVNRSNRHSLVCSGKAVNVSRVLNDLNRENVNLLQLGGPRVDEFLALCKKENISTRYIRVNAETRTCITIINEERHTSTELVEEANEVENDASARFYSLFLEEVGKHSAVVISGTRAPGFSDNLLPRIVEECTKRGIMTVLDIKGKDLMACLEKKPTVIKPNLSEICSTYDLGNVFEENENIEMKDKVEKITRDIYSKYGTKSVITRGKYDTWIFDGENFLSLPNEKIKVVNTVGCGDTLTGAMVNSLLDGNTLKDAVAFGMKCAQKKATHLSHGL